MGGSKIDGVGGAPHALSLEETLMYICFDVILLSFYSVKTFYLIVNFASKSQAKVTVSL